MKWGDKKGEGEYEKRAIRIGSSNIPWSMN